MCIRDRPYTLGIFLFICAIIFFAWLSPEGEYPAGPMLQLSLIHISYFKARYNTNETLFTLMMNYIAIQLTAYFCIVWEALKGSGTIGTINQATKAGWIPTDFMSGIFAVSYTHLRHIYAPCHERHSFREKGNEIRRNGKNRGCKGGR